MRKLCLIILLIGCISCFSAKDATPVTIVELVALPQDFEGQRIKVEGYGEFIGNTTTIIPFIWPYYDSFDDTVHISITFSEKTTTEFRLHDTPDGSGVNIAMFEEQGGFFIPMPYVPFMYWPAPNPDLKENGLEVWGKWKKNDNGYFLWVTKAEKRQSSLGRDNEQ